MGVGLSANAQLPREHRVLFKYKESSGYSLSNPSQFLGEKALARRAKYGIAVDSSDIPVSTRFLDSLRATGATVRITSRWLNTAVVIADSAQLAAIARLTFVQDTIRTTLKNEGGVKSLLGKNGGELGIQKIDDSEFEVVKAMELPVPYMAQSLLAEAEFEPLVTTYGEASNQIQAPNGHYLHQRGYAGQGMHIAVFDAGFIRVNTDPAFEKLRNEGRLVTAKDFSGAGPGLYSASAHGTGVLSCLASYLPGKLVGSAPLATYSIFRTEDVRREVLVEEDNYVAAAEYADSIGVDVITVSLGYNTFDDSSFNYMIEELNGKTSFISRGATMAARKGILVVNSAGNEGQTGSWKSRITMPADADSICTIGAIRPDGTYASFSSRGPTADGRIKPDLVFQGGPAYTSNGFGESVPATGTSFSAPVGAGLLACLWQAFPDSSAQQIIAMAKRCADQADAPDNRRGWGLPNFECALLSAKTDGPTPFPSSGQTTLTISPNPTSGELAIWFYAPKAGNYSLRLTDAAGRILGQFAFAAIEKEYVVRRMDISSFADGFYHAILEGGGQSVRSKIIKQNSN